MVDACFVEVVVDPTKVYLTFASLSIAFLSIFILRRFSLSNKGKISLMYTHLASLFFPISLFTTTLACGFLCLPCLEGPGGMALLALPTTLILSTIAGFVVIPGYFMVSRKSLLIKNNSLNTFLIRQTKKLKMKTPSLYILNMAKPVAFSFKTFASGIFLSVGLTDILKKKEIEAILFHELSHIKSKSSIFKISTNLMKFSPLSLISLLKSFNVDLNQDERRADDFVIRMQGSDIYLQSAKNKIDAWNSESRG